jgi:probable HAF family extracellular repeat protein
MSRILMRGFILSLALCITPLSTTAQTYSFSSFDVPGAFRTDPNGINNAGQIVGSYGDTSGNTHGFLMSGGVYTTIDHPGAATGIYGGTTAYGINDDGQIVGIYLVCGVPNGYGCERSFLLSGGVFTDLPDAPGSMPGTTDALSINNSGVIAGYFVDSCFCTTHGFTYAGGVYTVVDQPGFFQSYLSGINNSGQMVGESAQCWGCGFAAGFSLTNGEYTDIEVPGADSTVAAGINDAGIVAGRYYTSAYHAFVYDGVNYTLVDYPGAIQTALWGPGINRSGELVGGYVASDGTIHGFLATTFTAAIQPPINADGSSVFNANRGVVPVKFTLSSGGVTTCNLPPATISLTRTAGSAVGPVDQSVYVTNSDSGSSFRISSCQYVYNLGSKGLGPGTYSVQISIGGAAVGSAQFGLD